MQLKITIHRNRDDAKFGKKFHINSILSSHLPKFHELAPEAQKLGPTTRIQLKSFRCETEPKLNHGFVNVAPGVSPDICLCGTNGLTRCYGSRG